MGQLNFQLLPRNVRPLVTFAHKRYARSQIEQSVPHSLSLKTILSLDHHNYLKTRMCRSKPVGITRAKGLIKVVFCYGYVYVYKTRTAKHKKICEVSVVFHDEFVYVVP